MYRRRDSLLPSLDWPPTRISGISAHHLSSSKAQRKLQRTFAGSLAALLGSIGLLVAGIAFLRANRAVVAIKCDNATCRVARLDQGKWTEQSIARDALLRPEAVRLDRYSGVVADAVATKWKDRQKLGYSYAIVYSDLEEQPKRRSFGDAVKAVKAAGARWTGNKPMKQHRIYEAAANADMMEADFDTQPEPISRVANAEAKSKENLAAPAKQQQRVRPVLQRQNAVRFGLKDAGLVGGDSEDVILPAPESLHGGVSAAAAGSAPGGTAEASPRGAGDAGNAAAAQHDTGALQRRITELEGQLRPQGLDGKSNARGAGAGAGAAAPADASTDRRNGTDDAAGKRAGQDSVWDVSLGRGQRRLVVAPWNLGRIHAKIGQRTVEKYVFKYDGYAQALYLEERKFWRAPGVCAIVLGLVALACSLAFGTFRRSAAKAGGRQP